MSLITIDQKKYEVDSNDNLLKVCLSLGIDIPYFCWHPKLGSVGVCRQCAVIIYQNESDQKGQIIMSCMTPAKNGTIISVNNKNAQNFRKFIIELMMNNHPHDCPVCEEGGQCHLQDMTVMNKHYSRRYRFKKRTYNNQFLGHFILHEMNRCITCYRCVRYYKDYADGKDFGVYGIHNNIYFGRYDEGILENEFSGNLIDICPTGVFTDKINSKNYVRKWDMQFSPSICQHCSIGCNISIGERNGQIKKIDNRYNHDINNYFLCDLGRFGYEYTYLKNRPTHFIDKIKQKDQKLKNENIIKKITKILIQSNVVIGIGSPRASLESNAALYQLVGKEKFSIGISSNEYECINLIKKILQNTNIKNPSLREIEKCDAILILGEDITQTSPRLALSIRQAVKNSFLKDNIYDWHSQAIINNNQEKNSRFPLFITNIDQSKLDEISILNYYAPIEDQARLGFAIANFINKNSPKVFELDNKLINNVKIISNYLLKSKKPLIISGTHSGNISIIMSAYNIAKALKKNNIDVSINLLSNYSNSLGISIIGGKSLEDICNLINNSNCKSTLIVLENNIYSKLQKKQICKSKIDKLIVLDHIYSETLNHADFVIPVSNFAEGSGTLVNYEGRIQRFFQSYNPSFYIKDTNILESWKWLSCIYYNIKYEKIYWISYDDMIKKIIKKFPIFYKLINFISNRKFKFYERKIARSPIRYSGRTAICANVNVHEPNLPNDKDSIFSYSMENNDIIQNNNIPFVWYPGWNSNQALNKYDQSIFLKNNKIFLFNNNLKKELNWFNNIPLEYNFKKTKKWCIVPYYELFGSEETSQMSSTIKKLIPHPYAVINNLDSKQFNINKHNTLIKLNFLDKILILKIKISKLLTRGQIGLSVGLPNIPLYFINKKIKSLEIQRLNQNDL